MSLLLANAHAFSLLGPPAAWMDYSKSYQLPSDIGGPMNIGEGYRWNVPEITYGFDRSFLDYFGTNGVAAVDGAFQLLNQLPPAALINVAAYPSEAWSYNYQAQALLLLDLRSTVLSLLLEQLGLAAPERYTYCVREFWPAGTNYAFFVVRRNFDPVTAQPFAYVNDTLFTYQIEMHSPSPTLTNVFCDAVEFPVDPLASMYPTVAGFGPGLGAYVQQLSRDDVGGLKYLLGGNQIRYESLLPDVQTADPSATLVGSAYRPGIEKITFVRHPAGSLSGEFYPVTNRWTDVYYVGDYPAYQAVERRHTQPDILFTARDIGANRIVARSGTTNWVNHADDNGNNGGAGPGVIRPPILITLNNVGPVYQNQSPEFLAEFNAQLIQGWGSFDGSTNPVINYPARQVDFQPTQIRFRLILPSRTNDFRWLLAGMANGRFFFQTSTNLAGWTTLATLTNSGVNFDYEFRATTNESARFFRTAPEP